MTRFWTIALLVIPASLLAQHTVTIQVTEMPSAHRTEAFYITGSFNRWTVAEPARAMQAGNGICRIVLKDIRDKFLLEYKFNRGTWRTLESTKEGRLVAPRSAVITGDTTITCVIEGWRDDFPESTASAQVHLLDSAFYIPQLDRYRRIWVYLPSGYESSSLRYPVLYMHDGQDLFDEATSEGRIGPLEWGVDEVIDGAQKKCIVVAIEHHQDKKTRLEEYFVNKNPDQPVANGEKYLDFIVANLKPYVDRNYRTLPGKRHTFMAGSSMGGLITLYAGLAYPDVFGALGVLSPSIWLDHGNINTTIRELRANRSIQTQRYYFYAGDNENRAKPEGGFVQMHVDVNAATQLLKEKSGAGIRTTITPRGRHGAWYWRIAFPAFYEWLTDDLQEIE